MRYKGKYKKIRYSGGNAVSKFGYRTGTRRILQKRISKRNYRR